MFGSREMCENLGLGHILDTEDDVEGDDGDGDDDDHDNGDIEMFVQVFSSLSSSMGGKGGKGNTEGSSRFYSNLI